MMGILLTLHATSCDDDPKSIDPPVNEPRGDINLNGLRNEIADAVLYTNYFVHGPGVFNSVDSQTTESDVNGDGTPLTLGDLVYQIRIIVGNARPYPKEVAPLAAELVNNNGRLSSDASVPMGAALVVVEGNVTPLLLADDMELLYAYDSVKHQTRSLIYSLTADSFSDEFLNVWNGVISVEVATFEGHPVDIVEPAPQNWYVYQPYPNPCSTSTTFRVILKVRNDVTLEVLNILGEQIYYHSVFCQVGITNLTWNIETNSGQPVSNGVYPYRISIDGALTEGKVYVLR